MFTTNIRLSWEIPKRDGAIIEWFDKWMDTESFPTKDQILQFTLENSDTAYEKLGSILYLLNIKESKLEKGTTGDRQLWITNIPFDGCHISSIFILEVL